MDEQNPLYDTETDEEEGVNDGGIVKASLSETTEESSRENLDGTRVAPSSNYPQDGDNGRKNGELSPGGSPGHYHSIADQEALSKPLTLSGRNQAKSTPEDLEVTLKNTKDVLSLLSSSSTQSDSEELSTTSSKFAPHGEKPTDSAPKSCKELSDSTLTDDDGEGCTKPAEASAETVPPSAGFSGMPPRPETVIVAQRSSTTDLSVPDGMEDCMNREIVNTSSNSPRVNAVTLSPSEDKVPQHQNKTAPVSKDIPTRSPDELLPDNQKSMDLDTQSTNTEGPSGGIPDVICSDISPSFRPAVWTDIVPFTPQVDPLIKDKLKDVGGVIAVNIEPTPAPTSLPPNKAQLVKRPVVVSVLGQQEIPVPHNLNKLQSKHAFGLQSHECHMCVEGFRSVGLMMRHLKTAPKLALHTCAICVKGWFEPDRLHWHLNNHVRSTCRICNKVSGCPTALATHIKVHRRRGEHTRESYLNKLYRQKSLAEKAKVAKPVVYHEPRVAGVDNLAVPVPQQRNARIPKRRARQNFTSCYKYSKTNNYMQITKVFTMKKNLVAPGKRPFTCHVCGRTFKRQDYLTQHMYSHTGFRPFRCSVCNLGYFRPGKLVKHYVSEHCPTTDVVPELFFNSDKGHVSIKLRDKDKDLSQSVQCMSASNNAGSLQYYRAANMTERFSVYRNRSTSSHRPTDEPPTESTIFDACILCGEDIVQRPHVCKSASPRLQSNSRNNESWPRAGSSNSPHITKIPRSFNTADGNQLRVSQYNEKTKLFSCAFCSKEFSRFQNLLIHRRVHNGRRPTCRVCGKVFLHESALRNHAQIHGNYVKADTMDEDRPVKPEPNRSPDTEVVSSVQPETVIPVGGPVGRLPTRPRSGLGGFKSPQYCTACCRVFDTAYQYNVHNCEAVMRSTIPNREGAASRSEQMSQVDNATEYYHTVKKTMEGSEPQLQADMQTRNEIVNDRPEVVHAPKAMQNKLKTSYTCAFCTGTFEKEKDLEAHLKIHWQAKSNLSPHISQYKYSCNDCTMEFHREEDLKQHKENKHSLGNQKSVCPNTPKKTVKTVVPVPKKVFQCRFCPKFFYVDVELRVHLLSHRDERKHICDVCGVNFGLKRDLEIHQSLHHKTPGKPYVCIDCGLSFNTGRVLLRHHFMMHDSAFTDPDDTAAKASPPIENPSGMLENPSGMLENPSGKLTDRDQDMGERFIKSEPPMVADKDEVEEGEAPSCKLCGDSFYTEFERDYHMKCNHPAEYYSSLEVKGQEDGDFEAPGRKETYFRPREGLPPAPPHPPPVLSHTNDMLSNTFSHTSGVTSRPSSGLAQNISMSDSGLNKPQPPVAVFRPLDYVWNEQSQMSRHSVSEGRQRVKPYYVYQKDKKTDEECVDYQCLECPQRFGDHRALLNHAESHTGHKPYKCIKCGEAFSHHGRYRVHYKGHLEDGKFNCVKCGNDYETPLMLRMHECDPNVQYPPPPSVDDKGRMRPHACCMCRLHFMSRAHLMDHFVLHTPVRSLICTICGYGFLRPRSLLKHVNHHMRGRTTEPTSSQPARVQTSPATLNEDSEDGAEMGETYAPYKRQVPAARAPPSVGYLHEGLASHREVTDDYRSQTRMLDCSKCGESFSTEIELSMHKRRHRTEPAFMCNLCGVRFTDVGVFLHHKKVHEDYIEGRKDASSTSTETSPEARDAEMEYPTLGEATFIQQNRFDEEPVGVDQVKTQVYETLESDTDVDTASQESLEEPSQPNIHPVHLVVNQEAYLEEAFQERHDPPVKALPRVERAERRPVVEINLDDVSDHCNNDEQGDKAPPPSPSPPPTPPRRVPLNDQFAPLPPRRVGVGNFVCETCGRAFQTKKCLTFHTYTHTGEKPFKCEVCDEGFRQPGNLNYHLWKRHKIKHRKKGKRPRRK